jgi:hypothetical protein
MALFQANDCKDVWCPVSVNCNADSDAASLGEMGHQQSSPTPEWYEHYQISRTQNLRLTVERIVSYTTL